MSAPGPSALSLVDLAHAAASTIDRLVAIDEHAARTVADGPLGGKAGDAISIARYNAGNALTLLRWRWEDDGPAPAELQGIADRIGRGIVRPEWGLRVVAIATAAQAGKAASDG